MIRRMRSTVLALGLALAALALALEVAARAQARRIAVAVSPLASLEYRSAGIDWDGSLRLVAPRLTFHEGPLRGSLTARSVNFHGGGLLWTLAQSLPGATALPTQARLEMHGLAATGMPAADHLTEWLHPPGLVLFEMHGCEGASFSAADRQRMQAPIAERVDRIDYRIDAANARFEFSFVFDHPGLAKLSGSAAFAAFRPEMWTDRRARSELRLAHAGLTYADPGHLARRNAFCAGRNGMSTAQFIEHHLEAVDEDLARRGITPGEGVRRMYRDLVATGGTLGLTTLPDAHWHPSAIADDSRSDLLRLLNITARHNDAPPVMLQLAFSEPEAEAVVATPAAVTEPIAAPAGAAQPQPQPPTPVVEATVTATDVAAAPAPVQAPTATGTPSAPIAATTESPPLGASSAPPPENSTLALVWKPGVVERIAPREAPTPDYDVVAVTSLASHAGRRVRLLTAGGRLVDGELLRIEDGQAVVEVRLPRGKAEIMVALANVREARLVTRGGR